MLKLEVFDETFDPDRSESYQLSVQASLNGFSFCIMDSIRNQFIGLSSIPFDHGIHCADDWPTNLDRILKSFPWMNAMFKRVLFCYESPSFTLVPKNFFEPPKAKQLLSTVHTVDTLDEIRYNHIEDKMVSIFSIPTTLVSSWMKIQKSTRFFAFSEIALSYHYVSFNSPNNTIITLSLADIFATIIITSSSKLIHCGNITVQTSEDIVYHLINIAQATNIPISATDVNILGDASAWNRLDILINQYFKSAKHVSTLRDNHFSYQLYKYRSKFANLFNLSLCE